MKKIFPILCLLGCTALFVFGIAQLFALRFDTGDVYPEYSSLRADPLGVMAFCESLEKIPGVSVRRDFSVNGRLPETSQTVYLHLAASRYDWRYVDDDLFRELKNFLGRGGRLVIAFYPQTRSFSSHYWDEEEKTNTVKSSQVKSDQKNEASEPLPEKPKKKKNKSSRFKSMVNLQSEWGFHESFEELLQDGDRYEPVSVVRKTSADLPPALSWHSGMIFTNCVAAWKVLYARGTNPVVLERSFGKGSVVIASDSYFLSNEAMLKDRQPQLLAWLIGPNTHIVFDEAHLGITERPGIAGLMRQYRLHGLAAGLLILAGLFIWKNSTSLIPPHATEERADFVAGRDATSGFVNLLRRSVSPRNLLATCFAEWKKSAAPTGHYSAERLVRAEAVFQKENSLPAREQNPVAAYQNISETLAIRKPKT